MALAWGRTRVVARHIDSDRPEGDASTLADLLLTALVIAFFALLAVFALRLSL